MIDSYVECLVGRKKSTKAMLLKGLVYGLCGLFLLFSLLTGMIVTFILGLVFAGLGYFLCPSPDIEFEYLYMDKELTVDKIMAKQKRKRAGVYDLSKMEKMCPYKSHELDAYKNRKIPIKDYSSGIEDHRVYVIVYRSENEELLIFIEPNDELLAAIKNSCPRKVIEY